jgi:N-acetylglucosaminyl-diphospho-decaprenol L-rhamnosyltransferase
MANPDVAVVIVTYRSAQLTIEALRSVEAERIASRLRVRAIVVDNDSGDLPVIARAMQQNDWSSWLTLVKAPRNGGFAYGNNLGIAQAYAEGTPDYIYLLNPDTQVRPGGISALVRFLTDRADVGMAGSSFENLDGSEWPIAFRFPTIFSELDAGLQWGVVSRLLKRWVVARVMTGTPEPVDWICGASMMIRPAVLAAIGGMDENYFLYFEETDFCRRARLAGHSTWYVPQSRVMHIMGQSTSVTDPRQGARRLPAYWFESRRRYYVLAFGLWRAAAIDLVALLANSIGHLKRILQGKRRAGVPHYIRDLIRHSVLWPRNRSISAPSTNHQPRPPDSRTASLADAPQVPSQNRR